MDVRDADVREGQAKNKENVEEKIKK